ncbi:MAG: cyclic nucleotide-binding domain-containing protein [Chitinivibrionales bacterium]|nr:cyclic nucleotide-binding domain-containing protein [Chitinivibrionales bacterium]
MRYYSTRKKKFKRDEIIFSENSDCDGMYIINSGRVRIFKTVGSGTNVREVELCMLGPRAMFGEMAMIDNSKRSANVQAIEPTECTLITKKVFEDQLSRIPFWMVNMIRILVTRLRETNEKLRKSVEQYTNVPEYDTGSIITVDEESSAPFINESVEDGRGQSPMAQSVDTPSNSSDTTSAKGKSGMIVMGSLSDSDDDDDDDE